MPSRPGRSRSHSRRLSAAAAALVLVLGGLTATAAGATVPSDPAPDVPTGVSGDGRFTIAVLPDTQQEVLTAGDPRFAGRAQWLERNASSLDLRYITHSGDVVNWDTADHGQYEATDAGIAALDAGRVPWSFSIGNHDSLATGPGGGARPGGDPKIDARHTTTFNRYFGTAHAKDLRGTYQPGRIDNSYSTFGAEGTKWLVLNLELWARTGAVAWARRVVASHPDFNVVVVTHAMLTDDGSVQQDNGGYGQNSPQFVLDNLVRTYANVRFVFSGHAGTFGRLDVTGVHGNPVTLLQTTYHSNTDNPVRLVTIDVAHDRYTSKVYGPSTGTTYTDGSATSRSAMAWVRP